MSEASVETKLTHLLSVTVSFYSVHLFSFSPSLHLLSSFLLLFSLPTRSSPSQLLQKFSSCIAAHSLIISPSSLGDAPLSCNLFSLARSHRPFCVIHPSNSNSFNSLLFSFLVIFPGTLPSSRDLDTFQRLQELATIHQFWSHSLSRVSRAAQEWWNENLHRPAILHLDRIKSVATAVEDRTAQPALQHSIARTATVKGTRDRSRCSRKQPRKSQKPSESVFSGKGRTFWQHRGRLPAK